MVVRLYCVIGSQQVLTWSQNLTDSNIKPGHSGRGCEIHQVKIKPILDVWKMVSGGMESFVAFQVPTARNRTTIKHIFK